MWTRKTSTFKWQISLRSILLWMALLAIGIAWWRDHHRLTQELEESRRRIQLLETLPYFDQSPRNNAPFDR